MYYLCFFFFKQKTAYEMRISDWSSDVCSSDLLHRAGWRRHALPLQYIREEMKYLEDIAVGQVTEFPPRQVSEEEIITFARAYDPQPFHLDKEAAKQSLFGGLCASGWHTIGMMMRLMVDHMIGQYASMGSPGVDQLRWLKPVFPGDTIHLPGEVLAVRPSPSKPEIGNASMRERGGQYCEVP